jgi:hypothetical protein
MLAFFVQDCVKLGIGVGRVLDVYLTSLDFNADKIFPASLGEPNWLSWPPCAR